ncbi:hypothetical protein Tco_1165698 [Tanacetum coccineum]
MLAIPLHSQSISMVEIVSKEAQKKSKAGICFRLSSHNKHTCFYLYKEAQAARIDDAECDLEKDILLLEAILNSEPLSPLPNHANYFPGERKELKICEAKTNETSIDEPSEKAALIKVLQSHKRAIAWKLSDIKGINPEFCTHKILMEEDYTPAVQHQRRVNPKIHDVIKKEVEKLLNAGLIYPISDSPWVSPVHCVPKKGGFTVVENEKNELIPTRLVTGWRMLKRCEDTNLALNWEKSHFMVKEGIVLGHKISKSGIEDHSALSVSLAREDSKARLLADGFCFLREFDFDVVDTKGAENIAG